MIDLFKEVAEPSRRTLLVELRNGPRNVTDLVAVTGMKQPNVSNHLAKLRTKGIVRANKVGRQVFYSLASPDVANALSGLLTPGQAPSEDLHLDNETVKAFSKMAIAGDETGSAKIVDALLRQGVELRVIYQRLFAQSMFLVGKWYEVDAIDEGQEHLASAIVERLMARAIFNAPPPAANAKKAVIGCSAGNWHSIAVRIISDVMRVSGWQTLYLGANVPSRSFVSAVDEHQPDAVLVSVGLEETVPEALRLLGDLKELKASRPSLRIAVGGRPVAVDTQRFLEAGVDFTASDLDEFIDVVLPGLSA